MNKVFSIAWREFKHTALTKAFVFGVFGVPILVALLLLLMPFLEGPNITPLEGRFAVVAPDASVVDVVRSELAGERLETRLGGLAQDPNSLRRGGADPAASLEQLESGMSVAASMMTRVALTVEAIEESSDPTGEFAELKDRVRNGDLVALAVIPAEALRTDAAANGGAAVAAPFVLFVPGGFSPNHTMLLRGAVAEAVARARAAAAGVDFDRMRELVRAAPYEIKRLEAGGGEVKEQLFAKLLVPLAFMMLIWMSVFVSANYLLTTTIEEKSSKVMEVLLSAVSPMQLMSGKILGQGLVSAVMLASYGGVGMVALAVLASLDLVPISQLVYLAVFYVMAYFMIASLMAGVGSAANDIHEAQSLIAPAMILLTVPLMLWFPISENPNGTLATVTSFIPPLIPFVMILRVTAANEPVALWQIVLSIAWGYFAMFGMIWLAARVFRVGVLMHGKTPTPRELLKWIAYR